MRRPVETLHAIDLAGVKTEAQVPGRQSRLSDEVCTLHVNYKTNPNSIPDDRTHARAVLSTRANPPTATTGTHSASSSGPTDLRGPRRSACSPRSSVILWPSRRSQSPCVLARPPFRFSLDRSPMACQPALSRGTREKLKTTHEELVSRITLDVVVARSELVEPLSPLERLELDAAFLQTGQDGGPRGWEGVENVIDFRARLGKGWIDRGQGGRIRSDDLGDGFAGQIDRKPTGLFLQHG